jgi:hypothetical protein
MMSRVKKRKRAGCWLMPIILDSWNAEIGRLLVGIQFRKTVQDTTIFKITRVKWAGGLI